MHTLALDLASQRVGWALFRDKALVKGGTWVLSEGKEPPGKRWLKLLHHLNSFQRVHGVELHQVAYEEVTFHNADNGWMSAHRWGGALAIMQLWLESVRVRKVLRINVVDVKMVALGRGGGQGTDKDAMLAAARRRPGWEHVHFPDDNAADAAFVGLAAVHGMAEAREQAKVKAKVRAAREKVFAAKQEALF